MIALWTGGRTDRRSRTFDHRTNILISRLTRALWISWVGRWDEATAGVTARKGSSGSWGTGRQPRRSGFWPHRRRRRWAVVLEGLAGEGYSLSSTGRKTWRRSSPISSSGACTQRTRIHCRVIPREFHPVSRQEAAIPSGPVALLSKVADCQVESRLGACLPVPLERDAGAGRRQPEKHIPIPTDRRPPIP